jgi:transcriptional regulator with XRE-family HTH domain
VSAGRGLHATDHFHATTRPLVELQCRLHDHPYHYPVSKQQQTAADAPERKPDVPAVGALVRAERRRRNITLDHLAQTIGISKGHLSRFERDEKSLSVAALMRLSEALHTPVSVLLGERAGESPLHVVRSEDRHYSKAEADAGGYGFALLSRARDSGGPDVFVVDLSTDFVSPKDAFHPGEETFYVLSGVVEVVLPDRSTVLRTGDFAQFSGLIKHQLRGLEAGSQVLVMVSGHRD